MIKLLKYLKKSSGFIIMIVILLFVQAYCDLSLPSYTSDIVDVGIQQGGIENAVPLQIRKQTLQEIELFLTEEQKELVEQVRRIIQTLPEKFQVPLILFYLSDCSIEQIAVIIKKPPGTVKSRLFKGRKLIKKRLEDAGYER